MSISDFAYSNMSLTATFSSIITFSAIALYSISEPLTKTLLAECRMGVVLAQTKVALVDFSLLTNSRKLFS